MEIPAPAAEPVDELERLDAAQVTDGANTPLVEQTLRLGTDARNDPDGQRIEELLGLRRPDDRQAIGLLEVGGYLRDELVGPDADRAREPLATVDLALERPRVLGGRLEAPQG